jgi:hypothetical protein
MGQPVDGYSHRHIDDMYTVYTVALHYNRICGFFTAFEIILFFFWQLLLHYRKEIMYLLLHTFPRTPKSTSYILTGKWSNSHTYQVNIPGHPYCLWSEGLTKQRTSLVIPTAWPGGLTKQRTSLVIPTASDLRDSLNREHPWSSLLRLIWRTH